MNVFHTRDEHRAHLQSQSALPKGFRVGTTTLAFTPVEAPKPARMSLTLLALDKPTRDFAAVFTKNAFPGAPVKIGRLRLAQPFLGAIIINNKVSNVCMEGGAEDAERICAAVAHELSFSAEEILPSSTGVIGWRLPVTAMLAQVPAAVAALSPASILPAALSIMTTDNYPKVRARTLEAGRIVGIAKGAGMIEPNLATMLVYVLTDLAVPRDALRAMLARVADTTFNNISVDSDTSTSDTVVALSSGLTPCQDLSAFESALRDVCAELAEDVVRNGEGVRHVVRVAVTHAPSQALARGIGKAIVNAPLVKTAMAGNDANVGRIIAAVGKHIGAFAPQTDVANVSISLGGQVIFERGTFRLDPDKEVALAAHMKAAQLYDSRPPDAQGIFRPTVDFPPHERCIELAIDVGSGSHDATTIGSDLTHEYISENADYRS